MNSELKDIFPAKPNHVNYLVNWSTTQKLIYVETPKVGCTTLKQILQFAEYGYDDTMLAAKDHDQLHDRSLSPMKAPAANPSLFLDCLFSDQYFLFSFVRNPFSRILSAYLDKIVGHSEKPNHIQQRLNIDPSVSVPTFDEFIELVYSTHPVDMNPHWAPQSFLLALEELRYDFLGRFEFFHDSIDLLINSTSLQLPPSISGLGKNHSTSASKKLHQYFNSKTVNRVREIYQNDFEKLGYGWSL